MCRLDSFFIGCFMCAPYNNGFWETWRRYEPALIPYWTSSFKSIRVSAVRKTRSYSIKFSIQQLHHWGILIYVRLVVDQELKYWGLLDSCNYKIEIFCFPFQITFLLRSNFLFEFLLAGVVLVRWLLQNFKNCLRNILMLSS